jgi:hypothetical protein
MFPEGSKTKETSGKTARRHQQDDDAGDDPLNPWFITDAEFGDLSGLATDVVKLRRDLVNQLLIVRIKTLNASKMTATT